MGELKNLMNLRESRDKAKKTQAMLAAATGLDQARLSRYESGERSLSAANARKLAAALKNTNAATLVVANRNAMLQRAMDRGDAAGVMEAAKSAYEVAESNGWLDDDEGDEALSELLEAATKFVESAAGRTYADEEEDDEDYDEPGHRRQETPPRRAPDARNRVPPQGQAHPGKPRVPMRAIRKRSRREVRGPFLAQAQEWHPAAILPRHKRQPATSHHVVAEKQTAGLGSVEETRNPTRKESNEIIRY